MKTPHDATVANADLWAHYFREQWGRWLSPLGAPAASPVSQVAAGTAARVATLLTLVAAGPIAWLYATSAAERGAVVTELPQHRAPAAAEEAAA